jgi:hypothetical protein
MYLFSKNQFSGRDEATHIIGQLYGVPHGIIRVFNTILYENEFLNPQILRLGFVAGPVIQATGRSEFEDGLWSGDFVSGYSYHMSVRTRLSDHKKQTKFQRQRPTMLKHLFPLFRVQKCSNIGTVSTWMGDRLE